MEFCALIYCQYFYPTEPCQALLNSYSSISFFSLHKGRQQYLWQREDFQVGSK